MEGTRLPDLGSRGQGWVALQLLIFALVAAACVSGSPWSSNVRGLTFLVGTVITIVGAILALAALAGLGKSLTAMPKPLDAAKMKTTGAYALARHPIYGGVILVATGAALANSPIALVPAAGLALLLAGKRRVEERWLLAHYEVYADYMQRVRRAFIPFIW